MICFQVDINGRKLCIAGVGEFGVLTTVISMVKSRDSIRQGGGTPAQLRIGGTTSLNNISDENVEWDGSGLNVGDQVTITIVDHLQPEEPSQRTMRDPAVELERTKAHYEWLISELQKDVENPGRISDS